MSDSQKKIKISDVKYLSFEGGGGKGNAFLGAIKGLEKLQLLRFNQGRLDNLQIKGIAGSSAGAITAMLLASGHNYSQINSILVNKNFNDFFDPPKLSEEFIAGKVNTTINERMKKLFDLLAADAKLHPSIDITFPIKLLLKSKIEESLQKENPELADLLKSKLDKYLMCLLNDFGLFSGRAVHIFLHQVLCKKIKRMIDANIIQGMTEINPSHNNSLISFKSFFEIFKIDLKVTSVNLRTENLQILSKDTSPNFPVVTAIRMSMSLPGIFKPVIINKSFVKEKWMDSYWEGIWVDGGLFDNSPVSYFDPNKTLLLRLGTREANNKFSDFYGLFDFIKVWFLNIGIQGSGSGKITQTTFSKNNLIELNTENLSLLKFNLDPLELQSTTEKNSKIVIEWFDES